MRLPIAVLTIAVFCVSTLNLLADSAAPQPASASAPAEQKSAERQREGTRLIDQSGRFEFAGDQVAFFPADGKDSFRVLENLALERISRILSESRTKHDWTISGTLTEFRGGNYLLITKAAIKSSSDRLASP